jgi:hypothetical protein
MRYTRTKNSRSKVYATTSFTLIRVSHDRLNIVAESGLHLGCAYDGGKSTYAISCVSPKAACPTQPPSIAYASYSPDRRTIIHIAVV